MFVAEVTARTAADLLGINRHSATLFYHKLREMIAFELTDESPFDGEIEIDESYFGGVRKGKRGRGAAGKIRLPPRPPWRRCSPAWSAS
jgi:transposase